MSLVKQIRTRLYILKYSMRYSPFTLKFTSLLMLLLGILFLPISKIKSAKYIMASHRNCFTDKGRIKRETLLKKFNLLNKTIIDNNMPAITDTPENIFYKRITTLKEKFDKEKGVIILKYLDSFIKLAKYYSIDKILSDYYIVLELSYYGCCRPEVLQYMFYGDHNIFVGLAEDIEINFINRLNRNLIPADFSSSTWVDDRLFRPIGNNSKKYDCIMVGTWDPVKRHHILFRAIKKTGDPSFKAAIVGVPWGGTREKINDMIGYYKLEKNIDVYENASVEEVNGLINQSKVLVLTSLKEGGNKSIIESMMADTPIVVVSLHIGINRGWINENTGMYTQEKYLYKSLKHFKNNYHKYSPRKWAMNNISCKISTDKLESTIKEYCSRKGESYVKPMAIKVNRGPFAEYYNNKEIKSFDFKKYKLPTS